MCCQRLLGTRAEERDPFCQKLLTRSTHRTTLSPSREEADHFLSLTPAEQRQVEAFVKKVLNALSLPVTPNVTLQIYSWLLAVFSLWAMYNFSFFCMWKDVPYTFPSFSCIEIFIDSVFNLPSGFLLILRGDSAAHSCVFPEIVSRILVLLISLGSLWILPL